MSLLTTNARLALSQSAALRSTERGQAIIEFLVSCLAILPLFLLIPLIGKYNDIKQSTIAASRKLAFECTVRYADCARLNSNPAFADEIRMRYFGGNNREVLSNDRPTDDALSGAVGNPLWVDRQGRPLLERYSDVGIRADQRDLNFGGVVSGLSSLTGPARFGLQMERGMFDGRVQIALSPTNGGTSFLTQLDSLVLRMQQHTAILTDAWSARGPGGRAQHCDSNSNTVAGRASRPSTCNEDIALQTAEAIYRPTLLLLQPLQRLPFFTESNVSAFNFHDFVDERFIERVPTSDPVGYPRLQ
jgi:hypothetical protein